MRYYIYQSLGVWHVSTNHSRWVNKRIASFPRWESAMRYVNELVELGVHRHEWNYARHAPRLPRI